MVVYNITYLVEHSIHENWLEWMKSVHIPEMLSTGHFQRFQILRLREVDETEGISYAIQFYVNDLESYNTYIAKSAPTLRLKVNEQWGDRVIGFRTLMEIVH